MAKVAGVSAILAFLSIVVFVYASLFDASVNFLLPLSACIALTLACAFIFGLVSSLRD